MAKLSLSRRVRSTPFSDGVEAAGIKAYTVYNRMLLPTVFESLEYDYHHLKEHVQVWDVAVERQVELKGPDAGRLVQRLTPRDMSKMKDDQIFYIPVVDDKGGMLNDPVAIKLDEDRWWISIADSDLLLWIKGIALGAGMDVDVFEPDVSPLAVQGPKSDDLMARVFGEEVRDIRFFRQKRLPFADTSFLISRSGYSKQGGFEIYVEDGKYGMDLWNALFDAGKDLNVRPGGPNLIERIESGLLSYGNDMTMENSPFECGLGKFCKATPDSDHFGRAALEAEAETGPARQIRAIAIQGEAIVPPRVAWPLSVDGRPAGQITSAVWSPDFNTNVSIGMVEAAYWDPGTEMVVETPEGPRKAVIQEGFWN